MPVLVPMLLLLLLIVVLINKFMVPQNDPPQTPRSQVQQKKNLTGDSPLVVTTFVTKENPRTRR